MFSRRLIVVLSLLAFTLAAWQPTPAAAQFGALKDKIKKKAQDTVGKKPTASGENAASEDSTPREAPGTITPERIDSFLLGLQAEVAQKRAAQKVLGPIKSVEEYGKCKMEALMGADGAALLEKHQKGMENGDAKTLQLYADDIKALAFKHCGRDPEDTAFRDSLQHTIDVAGITASGMEDYQYGLFKERVGVFFAHGGAKAKPGADFTFKESNGLSYQWKAAEVDAMLARAKELEPLLKELL